MRTVQSVNPCKSVVQTIYDIVTKGHGGTLKVESKKDVGSEFIIHLLRQ